MSAKPKFIGYGLYDGRYEKQPDRAVMYLFCESLDEARRDRTEYGDDTVIVKLFAKGKDIVRRQIVRAHV